MKKTIVLAITVSFLGVAAVAQQSDVADLRETASANMLGAKPAPSPFSLLDPSRIKWSHSYSISFFSGGNQSGSAGLLSSTMFYELSPSLSLSLNVGILHDGGYLWGSGKNEATILPGISLDYHPSERFQVLLIVQRYSGVMSPYFYPGYRSWRHHAYPY